MMRCCRQVCTSLLLTATMTMPSALVEAQESIQRELQAIREELRALHREVAEQGRMIRALYDFVDSEIDFEQQSTERREEERLRLEPVVEITDANLVGLACANPVSGEIAAITGDGGVRMVDRAGGVTRFLKRAGRVITAVACSPDGRMLLVGTKDGAILTWDFSAEEWAVVAEEAAESVERVAWLGGTDKVVWGESVDYYGQGGQKLNRDKPSGGIIERATGETVWTYMSNIRDYQTLSGSPDGKNLAVLEIPDKPRGAYILDGSTGQVEATLFHAGHPSGPLSVCVAPDNATIAVGYAPRDVILWNAENEEALEILEGHRNWVVSLAFSADGRVLISGAGDSTARIWSVESGEELGRIRFPGESTYVRSVGFSPDGTTAYAMARGKLIMVRTPLEAADRGHDPRRGL